MTMMATNCCSTIALVQAYFIFAYHSEIIAENSQQHSRFHRTVAQANPTMHQTPTPHKLHSPVEFEYCETSISLQ
jgi:hypothetical protein